MSTQRIVNLIRSCLFTHGAPICSNMESCLAAKSSFPAQLIISSSGWSFLGTPQFSSRTEKISTSPKNEDGALEKCFCLAPSFETLTALQCQPCDCLLLQHLSHFYQTTKQILLPNFKTFFLMTEYQTTKNCDWYQQIKQFWLADNENYHR